MIAVVKEAIVFGTSLFNGSSLSGKQLISHGHCETVNFNKSPDSRNFNTTKECWSSYCSSLAKSNGFEAGQVGTIRSYHAKSRSESSNELVRILTDTRDRKMKNFNDSFVLCNLMSHKK